MNKFQGSRSTNATAFPVGDAQLQPPAAVTSGNPRGYQQGVPQRPQLPLKKKVDNLRIGSLNIGTMTGRGRETVDAMSRRRVEILCVQETKWSGKSARQLGNG